MKNDYFEGFEITRFQGGLGEFQETGIYPDYLHFYSVLYDKSWRVACSSDNQKGALSMGENDVFEFEMRGADCQVRTKPKEKDWTDWVSIPVNDILMD